jgi:hypothetical protein
MNDAFRDALEIAEAVVYIRRNDEFDSTYLINGVWARCECTACRCNLINGLRAIADQLEVEGRVLN